MSEIEIQEKGIELGEKTTKINFYYVVSYTIFATPTKNFYIKYFLVNNEGIKEYVRSIRKDTAIYMLSRLKLSEEQEKRVEEVIPYFETERLKIQLHDRLNDYEKLLTDEEILQQINKVQTFHFFGQHGECKRAYPHPPHILGYYNTVRYGNLPIFCTGRSGKLLLQNGKKVQLLKTVSCLEDCVGKYIFFKLMEE